MADRIEMTTENLKKCLEMAVDSTPIDGYGPFTPEGPVGEWFEAFVARTGDGGVGPPPKLELWCAWRKAEDGAEEFTALTGNGPMSEKNALFYGNARTIVLSMFDRIEELEAKLASLSPAPPEKGG